MTSRSLRRIPGRRQSGMMLIEVMIAALIFVLGIVGMLGVASLSVAAQSSAEYRTTAAQLTNEMAQQIWVGVNRSGNAADLRTSLLTFAHQTTGDAASCDFSGDASERTEVTGWASKVQNPQAGGLPGSTAVMQQVLVDTVDNTNQVTINVCWQSPNDTAPRRHSLVTIVN